MRLEMRIHTIRTLLFKKNTNKRLFQNNKKWDLTATKLNAELSHRIVGRPTLSFKLFGRLFITHLLKPEHY